MKKKPMFKQVALSALVLSAVAVPTVANAAKPESQPVQARTIEAIKADGTNAARFSVTTARALDPVEVARKYAPDTVGIWKETLAEYLKAVSQTAIVVDGAEIVKDGASFKQSTRLVEAGPIDAEAIKHAKKAEAVSLRAVELPKDFKAGQRTTGESIALKSGSFETIELREVKGVPAVKVTESTEAIATGKQGEAIATLTVASFDDTSGLAQALESKNADKIRAALSDLLATYQERIAEFERASK